MTRAVWQSPTVDAGSGTWVASNAGHADRRAAVDERRPGFANGILRMSATARAGYQGWVGQPPCHQVLLYCLRIVADQQHSGALLAPRKSRVGRLEADGAKVCWLASPPIPSMATSPDTTPCGIDSRDAARVRAAGMSGGRPCEDGCCYEVLCSRWIAGRCRSGSVADGMFHVEPGQPRVPVRV